MVGLTATKKIVLCGTSLTVNVTKEVQALGLNRGDYVEITINKIDNEDAHIWIGDYRNWSIYQHRGIYYAVTETTEYTPESNSLGGIKKLIDAECKD